ncbi:MAG: YqgE/AlgH family protein [Alphaproteobacteria bacterium]
MAKTTGPDQAGYLTGQLLIAMPNMTDSRFARAVIYMCVHNESGAMGIVVNKLLKDISFLQLLAQFEIPSDSALANRHIHFGGPVEQGRGFVLHSDEYNREGTVAVSDGIALTATLDILKHIAAGDGPQESLLALGYAGWTASQLENELQANAWLTVPADPSLVLDANFSTKWERAMAKLGIDQTFLSSEAGHA